MGCVSSSDDDVGQQVFDAATRGEVDKVEELLKKKPNLVNWGGKNGENYTPLMSACWNRHAAVASVLITRGARVNEQNAQHGSTALHIASFHGLTDIVEQLLACEADFDIADKNGKLALDNAKTRGHKDIIRILQDKRNVMNGFDEGEGKKLLQLSRRVSLGKDAVKAAKEALDAGADPDFAEGDSNYTPLMQALWNRNEDLAGFLMDSGADINLANKQFGSTPLHIACARGLPKAVQTLLDKGANTKATNKQGKMPIEDARAAGHQAIVDMIGGPPRNSKSNVGGNAMADATADILPAHWTTKPHEFPAQGWMAVWLDQSSPIFNTLSSCLQTDGTQLGKGRDVIEPGTYSKLVLKCAWRLENVNLWKRYETERDVVAGEVGRIEAQSFALPQVKLRQEFYNSVSTLPTDSASNINETFLLHGLKPDTVLTILQNGCNMRFSKGNFGSGTYLAEDAGKADQYVAKDNGEDPLLEELHTRLYRKDGKLVQHPGNVYYILVVRNLMGYYVRTKTGDGAATDIDWLQPVFATPDRRELAAIPNVVPPVHYHCLLVETGAAVKRFREFVQFHEQRIYPEYLLAYQRA